VSVSGEDTLVRPGSWNAAKAQEGTPGDLRDPIRVHVREAEQGSRKPKPRPVGDPPNLRERYGGTRSKEDHVGGASEPISER